MFLKARRDLRVAVFVFLAGVALPLAGPPLGAADTSVVPRSALAKNNTGRVTLTRLERDGDLVTELKIDGALTEKVWQAATVFDDFRVIRPDTLVEPPYATRLLFVYTSRGLYVGVEMEQPADELVQRLTGRDALGVSRDEFSLSLDTSGEGRYGYWMALALGDNAKDGTLLPERRYSPNWDGAWQGATSVTSSGWSAEYFIPWSQMAMPEASGERTIGFFASRQYARRNERWGIPALPRTRSRFMADFQRLTLADVNPRAQWSLFPYVSAIQDWVDEDATFKAGTDLFWRPSSNFQVTASLNPDFGGVEADDVIVNLTAFEVFFPERRLFFLEGQEVFKVSPRSDRGNDTPVSVINTRRIGGAVRPPSVPVGSAISVPLAELRQPAELLGAAKITGQVGALRYGVLGAFEDDARFDVGDINLRQAGTDYGAVRLLYENSANSGSRGVGVIGTLSSHPERTAGVVGVDGHFLSDAGRLQLDGVLLGSDIEDQVFTSNNGTGYGGFLDAVFTRRQGERYSLGVSSFSTNFQLNDLGFLRRNDATSVNFEGSWRGASGLSGLRQYEFSVFADAQWNGAGQTTEALAGFDAELRLANFWEVEGGLLYEPARSEDRNSFGNGTYRIEERARSWLGVQTNSALPVSMGASIEYGGEELGGHSYSGSLSISWRPDAPFNTELEVGYRNRDGWLLHQEARNFTTFNAGEWTLSMSGNYFISAKQQIRLALQWVAIKADQDAYFAVPESPGSLSRVDRPEGPTDDFSVSSVNLQLRYRWQLAPLSDLFVVYTRTGADETTGAGFADLFANSVRNPQGDQLVVKLRYRLGS